MKKKSKYILNLFLFLYFVLGFYLSINTGITTDEIENLYSWSLNLEAIKEFFGYNNTGFSNLYEYVWRYKGVGYFYFAQIYFLISGFLIEFNDYSETNPNPTALSINLNRNSDKLKDLIQYADEGLYKTKDNGGNDVTIYSSISS